MSFAQFEREVIGERIRDKVAASRKRGIFMGGWAPLGYDVKDRKLVVNKPEAELVRSIFKRFARYRSGLRLVRELEAEGIRNKYSKLITKTSLYKLLNNKVYLGQAVHKGAAYPGEHAAIISQELWDQVHAVMAGSPKRRGAHTKAKSPALLKGLIFGTDGALMTPTHTKRKDKEYRYYISSAILKNGAKVGAVGRIPAGEIERLVLNQIAALVRRPEIIIATWKAARKEISGLSEGAVRDALFGFDELWRQLFPAEQSRAIQLLVERIDLSKCGATVTLRTDGLASLFRDLQGQSREAA